MRIAVFTSNQPRHLSLISDLAAISDEVIAVQECTTVFPGAVDDFFRKSEVMQTYFKKVLAAERRVFGTTRLLRRNVRTIAIKMGDLSLLDISVLRELMTCDLHIVFGSSYIKGPLADELIARRAVNIHMGVSPYYRGSSCNFWALYDDNADLVGATIHRLSRGLDSGEMLFHALPKPGDYDPFELGMRAVRSAHQSLADSIVDGSIQSIEPVRQDRALQIRYTRNADFTDDVATEYLSRNVSPSKIGIALTKKPSRQLVRPRYF